ncbi:MAG: 2-isopropylmalate synthase, partial [Parvularculaceae bacterium]|nr:2-isopropylmalate synthase [Parvularculaceae bacterium]
HCHNDLGMAVANSLAAVRAGAAQVECTINGIGERAGNCALEEVVMALRTRRDHFDAETAIVTEELCAASRLLGEVTGQRAPRNKAIVGRNAFAHEAGIHQHGVLNDPRTYEIMRPADVGAPESALVLGKHSGKHALKARAAGLGVELGDNRVEDVFEAFKRLADEQGEVTDEDLLALVGGDADALGDWSLVRLEIRTSEQPRTQPFVRLTLDHGRRGRLTEIGAGDGPFDAAFAALCAASGRAARLEGIEVVPAPGGLSAEVAVAFGGRRFTARAVDADPVVAAARALVAGFNQIERRARRQPQTAQSAA